MNFLNSLLHKLLIHLQNYLRRQAPLYVFNKSTIIRCFDTNYKLQAVFVVDPEAVYSSFGFPYKFSQLIHHGYLTHSELMDDVINKWIEATEESVVPYYSYDLDYQKEWKVN